MKQSAPYYIKNFEILNVMIFRYSRILRRIYTFHIQCIIKVEDKTGKYNVCEGKLSFLGDIVSKLSYLQFFQGRKSTFLELIVHSLR
jgi:hypothetical protein